MKNQLNQSTFEKIKKQHSEKFNERKFREKGRSYERGLARKSKEFERHLI